MTGGLKIAGSLGGVGHILIARPDKRDAAMARLARLESLVVCACGDISA